MNHDIAKIEWTDKKPTEKKIECTCGASFQDRPMRADRLFENHKDLQGIPGAELSN